jgi:hypothetical protein
MSSFSRSVWRIPQYLVNALSPLLTNEVLHVHGTPSLNPHGAVDHFDRALLFFIPAQEFIALVGGTFTNVGGIPCWRAVNGADTQIAAFWAVPPWFTPGVGVLDLIGAVWGRPGGVVGSGNLMLGHSAVAYGPGSVVSAFSGPVTSPVPFGPETAGVTLVLEEQSVAISIPLLSLGVHVSVRRDGSNVLDTFGDVVNFVGAVVRIVMDQ